MNIKYVLIVGVLLCGCEKYSAETCANNLYNKQKVMWENSYNKCNAIHDPNSKQECFNEASTKLRHYDSYLIFCKERKEYCDPFWRTEENQVKNGTYKGSIESICDSEVKLNFQSSTSSWLNTPIVGR